MQAVPIYIHIILAYTLPVCGVSGWRGWLIIYRDPTRYSPQIYNPLLLAVIPPRHNIRIIPQVGISDNNNKCPYNQKNKSYKIQGLVIIVVIDSEITDLLSF